MPSAHGVARTEMPPHGTEVIMGCTLTYKLAAGAFRGVKCTPGQSLLDAGDMCRELRETLLLKLLPTRRHSIYEAAPCPGLATYLRT